MKSCAVLSLSLSLVLSACSSKETTPPVGACETDLSCDDSLECTVDSCGVDGRCTNTPIDERCPEGVCSIATGCTTTEDCEDNGDCDDGLECTLDLCAVGGICSRMALNERCPASQTCDDAMGCVAPSGCTSAAECDDSIDCTVDNCGVSGECENVSVDDRCAEGEVCSQTMGCYTPMPCETPDDCQDEDLCNGTERCLGEFGCAPAEAPRVCDDTDMCTIDSCDSDLNMCVFACDDSAPGCDCPTEVPCSGRFMVAPAPTQNCAFGQVNYNMNEVEFVCIGDILSVDGDVPSAGLSSSMTQTPRPDDEMFDVVTTIMGGCTESYRLTGAFTGLDTFEATFTALFTDSDGISCAFGSCVNQAVMVTGTRVP